MVRRGRIAGTALCLLLGPTVSAFGPPLQTSRKHATRFHRVARIKMQGANGEAPPQVWTSAVSTNTDLKTAVDEVAKHCLQELDGSSADLALVHCSSMYSSSQSLLVNMIRAALPGVKTVIGSTCAGVMGLQGRRPVEVENKMALGLSVACLPGVSMRTFHITAEDLPEAGIETDAKAWRYSMGLQDLSPEEEPIFLLYSSTQFMGSLTDFLHGLDKAFPAALKFGGISSTVSSLSRAQLFATFDEDPDAPGASPTAFGNGVAGLALWGDIRAVSYISQGARPVGPMFVADRTEGGTVFALRPPASAGGSSGGLAATISPLMAARKLQQQAPPEEAGRLATGLLLGVGPVTAGKVAPGVDSEAADAAQFTVQPMGRTAARDGSLTLSYDVEPGARVRFFVRDRDAATSDLDRCLTDYKRRELERLAGRGAGSGGGEEAPFQASGALLFPSFDRGRMLYGEMGYESSRLVKAVPVPTAGFFSNGAIGSLSPGAATGIFGTSTAILVFSPKTRRAKRAFAAAVEGESDDGSSGGGGDMPVGSDDTAGFEVRRRDVGSGRALSSGTVEYSVAEKLAQPRNRLEAIVWQKEMEIDRQRDKKPLKVLAGQLLKYNAIPQNKPRDLAAALRGEATAAATKGKRPLTLLAELKRSAPLAGVYRKDYDVAVMAESLVAGGAAALAVATDSSFFGGSLDHLSTVKARVDCPLLAVDVVIYAIQIWQARLAGADAIKLIAACLPEKDLIYFHKIARAAGMQVVVAVSSVQHMMSALAIPGVQMVSITNRNLANWSLDNDRTQRVLSDPRVKEKLESLGEVLVLSEGGIRTAGDVAAAREAGVAGVVVGEALLRREDPAAAARELMG